MQCAFCENKKLVRGKITHKYDGCGLDYVVLKNLTTYKCEKCGELYYQYGDINRLHSLIAKFVLLRPGLLTGKELKFLRVHAGFSGAYFAHMLQIDAKTLSRMENDKKVHSRQLDLLIRVLFARVNGPDRDYDLHDKILKIEDSAPKKKIVEFEFKKTGWAVAA
jgi:putative zinc finger/helix-turn-helix YgiT family protein